MRTCRTWAEARKRHTLIVFVWKDWSLSNNAAKIALKPDIQTQ